MQLTRNMGSAYTDKRTAMTMPSSAARSSAVRLDFLDGVRALAALWVLLGHAHLFALGWSVSHTLFGRPIQLLLYLHLAVDIFIVLSGFCLALPVVRNGNRLRESFGVFVWKRCRRILPPYYAVLILILFVNFFVPLSEWGRHAAGLTATLPLPVLAANFLLLQDVLPQYNMISGPFWSIAVEWHIYFFFPLIVIALRRFGGIGVVLGGSIAALGLTALSHRTPLISPWYIALFCLGVASAWVTFGGERTAPEERIPTRRIATGIGILLTTVLVMLMARYQIRGGPGRFDDHLYLIDPIAGAATAAWLCVIAGMPLHNPIRRLLEWKPLVALGTFSYSLYLTHIPLESVMYHYLSASGFAQTHPKETFVLMATLGAAVCIAFAYGFSLLFEKPFLRRDPKSASPAFPKASTPATPVPEVAP